MAVEIERKFLVTGTQWKKNAAGLLYRQGYLSFDKERTVRVRIAGKKGFLTIKGISEGISRLEFEYEIPLADANSLLAELCHQPLIEKKRYTVEHKGFTWEIDEFFGENKGLTVAELELASENQSFEKPVWIGDEVSDDHRYFNASLARHPFSQWKNDSSL